MRGHWASVLGVWALVGCVPRGEPASSTTTPTVASTPAATVETRDLGAALDAAPISVCAQAFADQRALYLDADTVVHPDREARFIEICLALPPAMQRCASPLYQIEHERECQHVHDEDGTPAARAWLQLFDVLSVPPHVLHTPYADAAPE